jgi:hypothetical protein
MVYAQNNKITAKSPNYFTFLKNFVTACNNSDGQPYPSFMLYFV